MRSDRRKSRRSGNDGSFWLSFSDLMSSLVLIIILVMFYIIYQYFNEAETNARLIAAREAELEAAQTQLVSAQNDLKVAQDELEVQQGILATRESELETAQTNLITAQDELESAQTDLVLAQEDLKTAQDALHDREVLVTAQQTELDTLSAQLSAKQTEIDTQQALLTSQQEKLEAQQVQLEQLVGLRTRIVSSVSEAFKSSGINASVDPNNGSIILESDLMFTSGDAELSTAGCKFMDRVLPIYLNVLFSPEYRPYVTEIMIEGHTDSDGTWLNNLKLSQERALAVAEYIFGTECKTVSNDIKNDFRQIVSVNGRSYSERVFRANGEEDKDASRRVVFKFRLTDEQMIAQLQALLGNEGVN